MDRCIIIAWSAYTLILMLANYVLSRYFTSSTISQRPPVVNVKEGWKINEKSHTPKHLTITLSVLRKRTCRDIPSKKRLATHPLPVSFTYSNEKVNSMVS
jgi:hypothetical protein